jgi:hypothetical protein
VKEDTEGVIIVEPQEELADAISQMMVIKAKITWKRLFIDIQQQEAGFNRAAHQIA